jgi:hypothetical protein
LKELAPKRLLFGALAFGANPVAGKLDRVVADFVPTDRHGEILPERGLGVSLIYSRPRCH